MEQHTLTVSERTHRLAGIALISGLVSSVVIISNFGPYALISSLSGSTKNLGNAAAAIAPDLVVTNTTNVTGYSQSNITLPGTITNTGTNNITNSVPLFKTYYWVDTDIVHTPNVATWGTQSSAINTIPPFDIGATQDVSATYTAPAVSQITTYYYRFCTDWTGDVSELDEGNNCSNWQTITINPPTIVCTPNTTTAAPNQNVTWTATVYGLPGSLNYSWSVTGGIPASKFTTTSN